MNELKNIGEDIYVSKRRRSNRRKENNLERDTKKYEQDILKENKTSLEKLRDELDQAQSRARSKTNTEMEKLEKLQSEFVKQKKRI